MMRLDLAGLADASREALMAEWREVVSHPPPIYLSQPLMVQTLRHTYQLDTVGGYTKRLDGRRKSAARRDVVRPTFKPRSRFVWKEKSFKSLSHTARAITGYKVSGFRFIGVSP